MLGRTKLCFDDLPESSSVMVRMMEMGQRWRWQEAVISAAGDQSHCAAELVAIPRQGLHKAPPLHSTMRSALQSWRAHCTWQVSFVEASGEFRTKPRYLPCGNVAISYFLQSQEIFAKVVGKKTTPKGT